MKKIILFLLIGFYSISLFAQTGPAGIESETDNILWLRADQGTSTTTDTDPVSFWNDISVNANNSAQAAGANQPLYISSGINILPTIRFDGDDFLVVPDADNLDDTDGLSIFVVAEPDNIDTDPRGLVSKRVSSGDEEAYALFTYSNTYLYFDSPTRNNATTPVTNDPQILAGVYNGTVANPRARIFQNGVQTESGNSGTSIGNMASNLHIGILNDGYGQGFRGDMSEVIIYRTSLNFAQRLIVEAYLANRYDISMTSTNYSSTTHLEDFTGIGHANGDKYSQTQNMGSGILLAERNNSLNETNEFVFVGHDGTPHAFNDVELPTITDGTLDERWARIYYIERVQDGIIDNGETDIRITFDYSESGLDLSTNKVYYLLYRSGTSGDFSEVPGGTAVENDGVVSFNISDANFASGYYTIARSDQEVKTWYSYNTGDWDDWETWSLIAYPGGFDNSSKEIPGIMDRAVIQNNKTVTVTQDNTQSGILDVIDGTVDFGTTTGHIFSTITGQTNGNIKLAADNFPSGDADGFAHEATGGTVIYYGAAGYELNTSRTFRNMIIDFDDPANQVTLLANYTLNGNLTLRSGELQFGDGTSTTDLNLTVYQNVAVEADGKILTGTGNARHQFNLYGDFANQGEVEFTNRLAANYTAEGNNGIVDVNFLSATRDQNMMLEGPSRFYRIAIEKGISNTYELYMESTDAAYFELFGYANEGHPENEQLTVNNNSFGLAYGTVRVGNNIEIPRLNGNGNYNISENAILWVDGGTVTKPSGTAVVVYGKVMVSDGIFNADINSGITTRINGTFESTGGTTNLRQFRTSVFGAQHQGGYVQSGGTVNLLAGGLATDYYRFTLTYPGNVFNMSGGTLHIQQTGGKGGIFINSDEVNQNVTGGTVICQISNANDFIITSKAPFWNLQMRKTVANSNDFILDEGVDVGGTDVYLAAQPLVVLNDLTLETNVSFDANQKDVYIGRNFTIDDGALYEFHENNTVFNGTEDGILYVGDITGLSNPSYTDPEGADPYADWEQPFYGFTIDKPSDATLTLATGCTYDAGNTGTVDNGSGCKNINDWRSNLIKVTGSFVLESGRFDIDEFSVRLYDEITNKGIFGLSGMPKNALIKLRKESTPATRVVNTTDGAQFGNLRLNSGPGIIEFTSDVYVKRMQYRHGRMDIGTHNLKIDTLVLSLAGGEVVGDDFSVQDMIIMDGNASDGGLSLYVPQVNNPGLADSEAGEPPFNSRVYFFPIGTGTTGTYPGSRYTPANIRLESVSDDGYVTVNIVSSQLQTTAGPVGNDLLNKYFRIRTEGFSTPPKVERYRLHFTEADIPDGTNDNEMVDDGSQTWNPGYVLDENPYTRTYEINDGATASSGFQDNGTQDIRVFYWGNEGSGNPAGGFDLIEANYTAGDAAKFVGTPEIYYNRRNGTRNWNNNTSWYDTPTGTNNPPDFPTAGDIVVIRGDNFGDAIRVSGTQAAAKIIFQREGTYTDIEDIPRLFLNPTDVLNVGMISGIGELYLRQSSTNSATVNADIGEYVANDTSVVIFYMTQNGTYNVSEADFFTEFPVLRIYGQGAGYNRTASFNYDFKAKQLLVDGEANLLVGGNYTVENRTRLGYTGGGRIVFPNGNESYRFKTGEFVTGRAKNEQDNNFQLIVETGGSNGIEHIFEVERDINLNFPGTVGGEGSIIFDLFSTLADNNVILRLSGEGIHAFDDNYSAGNSTVELYKIEIDKGTSISSSFTFNDDFTLNGLTSGVGVDKALKLTNGKLVLNDADIDIDLTTGDDSFVIPSSAGLVVSEGEVNVSGDDSGIILDGLLRVETGGVIDMDGGAGVDNFIEYSASGNATIQVTGGTLTVGSQIRRGTSSDEGILKYTQTGGTVTVGKNAAPDANRGVFEVINSGSRFYHLGGTLSVVRPTGGSEATVLLEPSNSSVTGTGTTLQLGNATTPASTTITLKSKIELGNLTIGGTSTTAQLMERSLTVKRDLTIDTGCSFSGYDGTNYRNLTVKRNILNSGTANFNVDTLLLTGTSTSPSAAMQEITGNLKVNHLVVEPENSVTLQASSGLEVDGDLYINEGQFIDGGNEILVKGDVTNEALHASPDPNNGGLVFNGGALQRIYGTGQFGRIELDNSNGVQLENSMSLNNHLTLTNGSLLLQSNKLTLGLNANIIKSGADFGDNKMIAVGGGDFIKGIEKTFRTVTSATPTDPYDDTDAAYTYHFTFPIGIDNGTLKKYTPVDFNVASNATQGSVSLHPVNRKHITLDDTQTDVLQYYWIMNSSGLSDFTSLIKTHYKDADVVGDETVYIGAKLYDNSWAKLEESTGIEVVYEADDYVAFITDGADLVTGDYTAGIEPHIPDDVPIFYSKQDGDWTDANTWERGDGGTVPANGPSGQRVHIRTAHTVTVSSNYRRAYRTRINGRLELGTSYNHILGYVTGTGTLSTESSSLPSGNYDDFFACGTGGTMEWDGGTYGLPSSITQYNNLTVTGTGTKTMPGADITICGDLRIEGDVTLKQPGVSSGYRYTEIEGDVFILDNSNWDHAYKVWVKLKGDLIKASTADNNFAYSYQTVEIIGTENQIIEGDYTGSNRFNNFYFRNPNIVQFNGPSDIGTFMYLYDGRVVTTKTNIVTITRTSSAGNGFISYSNGLFEGPVRINLNSSSPNKFLPVGKNNIKKFIYPLDLPSTVGYWTGEYFNTSPTDAGMSHLSMDNPPLETISQSEYWSITGPAGVASSIELTLNGTSDVAAGVSDLDLLRIVYWDGAEWVVAGGGATITGDADNGTISTTGNFTFDGTEQYFTIGAVEVVEIITATIASSDASICESDNYDLDVTIVGNHPNFELDYSIGADTYTVSGIGTLDHTITLSVPDLSPGSNTITLNEIRDSDTPFNTGSIIGGSVTVTVYDDHPAPYTVTSGGDICGATTTTVELDVSDVGFTYELYRDGIYFSSLDGTGGALSFTVDQAGTYTVGAYNTSYNSCTANMDGSAEIMLGSAVTAEITSLISAATICEGEAVEMEITFTGTPPFTFTVEDNDGGSWADIVVDVGDLSGAGPYTYNFTIPDQFPVWTAPDLPNEFTYSITSISDDGTCGAGTVVGTGVDVDVYKIPETGPQYHISNDWSN